MSENTETPKKALPESGKEKIETKDRLALLKQEVQRETANTEIVTKFLEQYLENTEETDGDLPDTLTTKQFDEISKAFATPAEIEKLIALVSDVPMKAELSRAGSSEKAPEAGTMNSLIERVNGYVSTAMNHATIKPIIDKVPKWLLKKEMIVSVFLAFCSKKLLEWRETFPQAQAYAAEIAFQQCGMTIAGDKKLSPKEKNLRAKAYKTEEGKRNFMVAFDDWVAKNMPPSSKPNSAVLLGYSPAPVQPAKPEVKADEKAADKKPETQTSAAAKVEHS